MYGISELEKRGSIRRIISEAETITAAHVDLAKELAAWSGSEVDRTFADSLTASTRGFEAYSDEHIEAAEQWQSTHKDCSYGEAISSTAPRRQVVHRQHYEPAECHNRAKEIEANNPSMTFRDALLMASSEKDHQ